MISKVVNNKEYIGKDRKKFIIAMIVFAIMFFVRDVFNIVIPQSIFLLVACFYYLIFDLDECIAFTATLAVWGSGFQANYAILFGLFAITFKKYNKIVFSYEFILLIFIIIWEALHIFYPPFSVAEYARYMVNYVMIWIVLFDRNTKFDYMLVVKSFLYVAAFLLLDIMAQTLIYYKFSLQNMLAAGVRFGNIGALTGQENALSNNQNVIAMFCGLSIGMLTMFLFYAKKKERIKYIFVIGIFLFFGLLTQSRAFIMLVLLAYFFAGLYYSINHGRNVIISFTAVILALILVYLLIVLLLPSVWQSVVNRLLADDISGGRISIFKYYNNYILDNTNVFFFGLGLQDVLDKVNFTSVFPINNVPHNGLQEAFLVWGIVGIPIVLLIFMFIVKNASQDKKIKIINYLPLILYFSYIQVAQFLRVMYILMILITLFSCIRIDKEVFNEKRKQNK